MFFTRLISLILLALVTVGCANTTVRHSSDYKEILHNQTSVVLPAEARVYEVEFSGNQKRLYDFEYNIESIIAEKIIAALDKHGIKADVLSRKKAHEQGLIEDISRLDERYQEIDGKLYKESMSNELAFSINETVGDRALNISQKSAKDLVVMVKYQRYIKGSGSQAIALGMALFGSSSTPADMADLKISIIEGKTGKVLWTNLAAEINGTFFSSDNRAAEEKNMEKLILKVLEPISKD